MQLGCGVITQKFGYQRADYYTGVTNEEKYYNGFDRTIYFPTNWRGGTQPGAANYSPLKSKFPVFLRYGGLTSINPEYIQKNYAGIYPITQQPVIDEPKPFMRRRFS